MQHDAGCGVYVCRIILRACYNQLVCFRQRIGEKDPAHTWGGLSGNPVSRERTKVRVDSWGVNIDCHALGVWSGQFSDQTTS